MFLFLLLNSCQKQSEGIRLESIGRIIDNRFEQGRKKLKFFIINNPFDLEDFSMFYVYINGVLVTYDHLNKRMREHTTFVAYVPDSLFGRRLMANIIFKNEKSDEIILFPSDYIFYLDIKDKYLFMLFNVNRHSKSDVVFFSQKEDIYPLYDNSE
jgi:hypothetical protein